MSRLTIANQLTILRIALVPFFVLFVLYERLGTALLVFLVAGITDALDGLAARLSGQRTSLGAWLGASSVSSRTDPSSCGVTVAATNSSRTSSRSGTIPSAIEASIGSVGSPWIWPTSTSWHSRRMSAR